MRDVITAPACSTLVTGLAVPPPRRRARGGARLPLAACLAAGIAACAGSRAGGPTTLGAATPLVPAPQPLRPPSVVADPPATPPSTPATASQPCASVVAFRAAAPDRAAMAPVALARAYLASCGREQIVALTSTLVGFPTVSSREPASSSAAFRDMGAWLRGWTDAHGLRFAVVGDQDAWEVSWGEGPRTLGFVMHGDVVPEAPETAAAGALPPGWTHPPFAATVVGGRLYGRGTIDDKGPIAAVLVSMAALHEAGVRPRGEVLAILGLGEESEWEGMERYAGSQPLPESTISIDAGFPVVVGEDGFVAWYLALPSDPPSKPQRAMIVDLDGGGMLTQVPGDARMTMAPARGETVADLEKRVAVAIAQELAARGKDSGFALTAAIDPAAAHVVVRAKGVAVHSSMADTGKNAIWPLAGVARRLKLERNGAAAMLDLVAQKLDGDLWGQKLGLAYSHPTMGKLVVSADVLKVDDGRVLLGINMRRPAGPTSPEFSAKLDAALARLRKDVDPRLVEGRERYVGEAHLVPPDEPLVTTLLDAYRRETGDAAAAPMTIRGGTYARLFPGAVSFGPELPGKPYSGHAPDEWVDLADLDLVSRLVVTSIERLALDQPSGRVP